VRPMIAAPSDIRSAIRVYYQTEEVAPAVPGAAELASPAPPELAPPTAVKIGPKGPPPLPPPLPARAPPEGPPPLSPPVDAAATSPESVPPESAPLSVEEIPPSEPVHPTGDSPDAWPEVEARTMELPRRKGGPKMVALTLLDGTTIQLPAKPRRRRDADEGEGAGEAHTGPQFLANMTARDLIKALGAVAEGADAREVFGERVPIEAICAALLSLLLRKGVIADWEFVEELKKRP